MGPTSVWLPIQQNIFFNVKKKLILIKVWNLRESKWWMNFHFGWAIPLCFKYFSNMYFMTVYNFGSRNMLFILIIKAPHENNPKSQYVFFFIWLGLFPLFAQWLSMLNKIKHCSNYLSRWGVQESHCWCWWFDSRILPLHSWCMSALAKPPKPLNYPWLKVQSYKTYIANSIIFSSKHQTNKKKHVNFVQNRITNITLLHVSLKYH